MSATVTLDRVHKAFPSHDRRAHELVLDDFSLHIDPGELVALVGPSGCGKTTILNLVAGLQPVDTGRLTVSSTRGAAPRVAVVFQQPRLLDWLRVRTNVTIAAQAAGTDPARAEDALHAVGLGDYLDAYPTTLSGGQRQRVAIARAFTIDPELLLLDEPFSALDELTARHLRDQLQHLWLAKERTGILVTHNPAEAVLLADRVAVLGPRPTRLLHEFRITVPRPRNPDDHHLLELQSDIISTIENPTTAADH